MLALVLRPANDKDKATIGDWEDKHTRNDLILRFQSWGLGEPLLLWRKVQRKWQIQIDLLCLRTQKVHSGR